MSPLLNLFLWIVGSIAAVCWVLGAIYVGGCALAELVDAWQVQRKARRLRA